MITSAFLLVAHGVVLLFDPELLFKLFNSDISHERSVAAQLFSAALIGFGLMNWTGRGLVLGGVYGRPLVHGNFAFAFISLLVGIRACLNGFSNVYSWSEVVLCSAFAIVFGFLLFRGPTRQKTE